MTNETKRNSVLSEVAEDTINQRKRACAERKRRALEDKMDTLLQTQASAEALLAQAEKDVELYKTRCHDLAERVEKARAGDETAFDSPKGEASNPHTVTVGELSDMFRPRLQRRGF